MLFVQQGRALWNRSEGMTGASCATCHGDAETAMRGVAARYPAMSSAGPVDLAGRINLCRTRHQQAEALAHEDADLLALTAFVALPSRRLPITPAEGEALARLRARGAELWSLRQGQLNLACATCHDDNAGRSLGGVTIPQAHPVGYPVYRLEWAALGSLRRRIRGCLTGIRAETWPADAPEFLALELFLMDRARGMNMETPSVRP
jgi:sulfur-oxidizing protein SoxA